MIIFSGNTQLRQNEYGIYFVGANFNCFDAPSLLTTRVKDDKPVSSGFHKLICSSFNEKQLTDSIEKAIVYAASNQINSVAIPCPYFQLDGVVALRYFLDEIDRELDIRIIIHKNHLQTINSENNRTISGYVNRNYTGHSIQYSIGEISEEQRKRAEKTRREREERYRKSIDYSHHVKLSPEELREELNNRKPLLEQTFSDMLFDLINEKHMDEVEVYKRANLDKRHFSKIRSNSDYRPSKATALSLCIALRLNIEETEILLNTIGVTLSRSDLSDVIVKAFILNEIYDLDELNLCLLERNLKPLSYY